MKLIPQQGFGPTHGSLTIYSAPRAVLKHIEWGLAEAIGSPISLRWTPQPLASGTFHCTLQWRGAIGTASRIATQLRGWHYLRFELCEAAAHGSDGSIYMFEPHLGLFRADVGPHGDIMINENQIAQVIRNYTRENDIVENLELILGKPWDVAFEPFRRGLQDYVDGEIGRLSV